LTTDNISHLTIRKDQKGPNLALSHSKNNFDSQLTEINLFLTKSVYLFHK